MHQKQRNHESFDAVVQDVNNSPEIYHQMRIEKNHRSPIPVYPLLPGGIVLVSPMSLAMAAQIPLFILPTNVKSSPEVNFFLHHYYTHTSSVIFPLSLGSNPLREVLLQAALGTPHLLHALLASAANHYGQLRGPITEMTSRAIAKFTHTAILGLRQGMMDPNEVCKIETVSTALALCTSDVISGNMSSWRFHLSGIHKLILSAQEIGVASPVDPAWMFLVKWYETLDMFAGISGLRKSIVHHGKHRSTTNVGYIDEFVGFSLELMPLLVRIGRMARRQQKRKDALRVGEDSDDESLRRQLCGDMGHEVRRIESHIYAILDRKAHPPLFENAQCKAMAQDMELTHQAFIYASLLHLYRRVADLPKEHVKPAYAVYQIVDTVQRLPPGSVANILILWPVFTAGCETDNLVQRNFIKERMRSIEAFGMGNVSSAIDAMTAYWNSGTNERWDIFLDRQGDDIVLF